MDVKEAIRCLEQSLVEGSAEARAALMVLERTVGLGEAYRQEAERHQELLDRSVRIAAGSGLTLVAGDLLEALMAVVDAPRGFFGVVEEGGWRVVIGRGLGDAAGDPSHEVSAGIIDRALASAAAVVEVDAQAGDFADQRSVADLGLRSVACFPVGLGEGRGFVYVDNPVTRGFFDAAAVAAVRAWLPLFDRTVSETIADSRREAPALPGVVTRSSVLLRKLGELRRVASYDVPVLLWGETGTGKSLIARRLHEASKRRRGPFVHVNCAALPADLVEAELFGAEVGAYTGAQRRRIGRFEAAAGGTLFLDELDLLPNELQAKLLVAIQERQIIRLGSNTPIDLNVRVVSAMSSEPQVSIHEGRLREELYFRLAVIEVAVPPLRERPEDVPLLARYALESARSRFDLPPLRLAPEALRTLLRHTWPGNVRELENALDRAALLNDDGVIRHLDLRESSVPRAMRIRQPMTASQTTFARRRYGIAAREFMEAWRVADGRVEAVAEVLGVTRRTVYRLRQKYESEG